MKETEVLKVGGVILYPTDTVWGLGCDATNEESIKRIIEIKGRDSGKNLLILVKDEDMLKDYVEHIPDKALDVLRTAIQPTTIIYPKAKNLPIHLLSSNESIGIRIPNHDFCQRLLSEYGKPIVSTSANTSGKPTPLCFSQIESRILEAVDYVSLCEREEKIESKSSSIILIDQDNNLKQIR